ncbi:hypothetical protein SASPL_120781 [Salvia splendens]|uniref:Integrator complex subunit 3 N-terminal domain-containing protein n=1 Tax=Salvia splendens TaxID=180675 RepID=A0A8X8ZU87_SALSN|nr:hypothetical protein SASPL_120781 [Salvia splendens]
MTSKLTVRLPYEAESSLEITLRQTFYCLEPQLRPHFPLTIPTQEQYSLLNKAILYAILSEPHLRKIHINHLHGVITDGYGYFTSILVIIVNDIYGKLVDSAKRQLLWITREMVDVATVGFTDLLGALLRQIVAGDSSEENLWVLRNGHPFLQKMGLPSSRRLIGFDCCFVCVSECRLITAGEKFGLCLRIGRDLVRLLQDLVHVPEFRVIWRDLLYAPSVFGVGIIQRWAVIGWLLKSSMKNYITSNMKLALFYDWLFFTNIEPALLLMVHSIPEYIDITNSLFEFLFLLLDNYDLERKEIVLRGISSSLHTLLRKGVVGSLEVLTRCDKISLNLKERLAELLSGYSGFVDNSRIPTSQML